MNKTNKPEHREPGSEQKREGVCKPCLRDTEQSDVSANQGVHEVLREISPSLSSRPFTGVHKERNLDGNF